MVLHQQACTACSSPLAGGRAVHHRRLYAPRSTPRASPSARHGARVLLAPLLSSRLHSLQAAPRYGLQQQARLARRHGFKVAASSAAAISIDSMPADGSPPSIPDTQIPAWNLRARWKAWWDLKGALDDGNLPKTEYLRATLRRIWFLIKGERLLIACASVFMTLAALAELLIPHYVSASIFSIANKLPASTFHNNVKMLAVFAFSYGICAGIRGFFVQHPVHSADGAAAWPSF
jgi:hypothetical protein